MNARCIAVRIGCGKCGGYGKPAAINTSPATAVGSSAALSAANCPPRLCPPSNSGPCGAIRSEEHTSELQSLMRISYAVFCLKKNQIRSKQQEHTYNTRT